MMIRMLDRRPPSRAVRDVRPVAAVLSVSLGRYAGPAVGAAVAGLLCLLEGVVRPYGPDLSAQLARADASARGVTIWWAGWYGGTNVVGYSWLSGPVMQHVGVISTCSKQAPRPACGSANSPTLPPSSPHTCVSAAATARTDEKATGNR